MVDDIDDPTDIQGQDISFLSEHFGMWPEGPFSRQVGRNAIAYLETENEELIARVFAASSSVMLGNGLEYTYKRYRQHFFPPKRFDRLDWRIHLCADHLLRQLDVLIAKTPDKDSDRYSHPMIVEFAFMRLCENLRVINRLAQTGNYHEAAAVTRVALETVAWVAYLMEDNPSDPFAKKPQECIRYLKSISESGGSFYGLLSEISHFHKQSHYATLDFSDERVRVVLRSAGLKCASLAIMLAFMVYLVVITDRFYSVVLCKDADQTFYAFDQAWRHRSDDTIAVHVGAPERILAELLRSPASDAIEIDLFNHLLQFCLNLPDPER